MSSQPVTFDAPLQQAMTVSLPSPSPAPTSSNNFTAPSSGQQLQPGQPVSYSGRTGIVQGQHPNGKAIVHWDDPEGTTDNPAGVSFDAPLSQGVSVPLSGQATAQSQPQPKPTDQISAVPEPTSMAGKLNSWAQNVASDIEHGTDITGVGSVLKKLGAHGVYNGNPQAVGDFMASLPWAY